MFNLRSMPAPVLLLLFLLFALAVLSVFQAIGFAVINAVYDVDLFSNQEVINDLTHPHIVAISRWLMLLNHIGLFIVPALIFPRLMKYEVPPFYVLDRRPPFKLLLFAIVTMALIFPLMNLIHYWNVHIDLPDSMQSIEDTLAAAEESAAMRFEVLQRGGGMAFALNVLLVCILPAIGEELVFRGMVLKQLMKSFKNIHVAIWVGAFLFSAMHFQFYGFFPRMLYGALFGYFFIWTGTLWVPIVVHFLNNLATLTGNYLMANETLAEDSLDVGIHGEWALLIGSTLCAGVLLYFMAKQSRWQAVAYRFINY